MGVAEQRRLNLLFEMENIKTPLMNYISPGVNLKVVVDLGNKDKNGCKRRFYEEVRYPSNKYKNLDYLVSANFRINTYIVLEYPNPDFDQNSPGYGGMKTKSILIKGYAIEDIVSKMRLFTNNLVKSYKIIGGELTLLSDKIKEVKVYPSLQTSLSFSPAIYENNMTNTKEMGVRIIINGEYDFIISAETIWPEMIYRLSNCDLTMIGIQMIQSYMSLLPGMATNDLNSNNYNMYGFRPYWGDDPDDTINSPEALKVVGGKPTTHDEKVKSFFGTF